MANKTLILLRHGNTFESHETPYQIGVQTDLPLTETGKRQAQDFSFYLKEQKVKPAAIYCGSLQRQIQTAQILKSHFYSTPLFLNEITLNEIDYGLWEGLTLEAIQTNWPTEYLKWCEAGVWPTVFGKSLIFHLKNLENWLNQLNSKNDYEESNPIIVISSNGILRLFLYFIPALWQSLIQEKKLHNYKVGTGHFCEMAFYDLQGTLKSWNIKPLRLGVSS